MGEWRRRKKAQEREMEGKIGNSVIMMNNSHCSLVRRKTSNLPPDIFISTMNLWLKKNRQKSIIQLFLSSLVLP